MIRVSKQDVVLSGGFGTSSNSARAGFIPIALERLPLEALDGIPVHLRFQDQDKSGETFRLYCAPSIKFTADHRDRLLARGSKFIYIPMAEQGRFRKQTEDTLLNTVSDPTIGISVKSEIVYETSVELVNELLSEPDLGAKSNRLEKVSRAITTLVLNDPTAFSHLFAASHHDFYTATHMVNVATWMVPLAYAMGYHNTDELNHICQAGLLHDVGKVYIPADVLNKKGKLSNDEWDAIRRHPELGCKHFEKYEGINPLVMTVTREHHERLDGSGYPSGCKGDKMHPISRICSVIDSFDAMTAFRPFKERTMSVAQALAIIMEETPSKYDQEVVEKWIGLLQAAEREGVLSESVTLGEGGVRRQFPRFPINCPARLHILQEAEGGTWNERPALQVIAHSISRSGAGFVSQSMVRPGEHVRLYLKGEGSLDRMDEGVVVRCRSYRDGSYEVGVKFATIHAEVPIDDVINVAA